MEAGWLLWGLISIGAGKWAEHSTEGKGKDKSWTIGQQRRKAECLSKERGWYMPVCGICGHFSNLFWFFA